jgi:hypothetical protein
MANGDGVKQSNGALKVLTDKIIAVVHNAIRSSGNK